MIAVAGANLSFDPRQEPLTYYHRTGPVGAMFRELRTPQGRGRREGATSRWSASGPGACRATRCRGRSSRSTRSTRR